MLNVFYIKGRIVTIQFQCGFDSSKILSCISLEHRLPLPTQILITWAKNKKNVRRALGSSNLFVCLFIYLFVCGCSDADQGQLRWGLPAQWHKELSCCYYGKEFVSTESAVGGTKLISDVICAGEEWPWHICKTHTFKGTKHWWGHFSSNNLLGSHCSYGTDNFKI